MFFIRRITRWISLVNHFTRNVRYFGFRDKNFDYFRNNEDYKHLVVPLERNKYVLSSESDIDSLNQRENVMKLTSAQIKDILSLAAAGITNVDVLPLKFLDEKCALSANRWPLDFSFYILDAWSIILGSKVFRKHFYAAITGHWSHKIHKCSKSNLVLILYFVGLSKFPPPFLLESVVARMESILPQFSDLEIALAALSLFKCSKKVESVLLLKRCCTAAENLLKENDRFNAISILKCLRLSDYYYPKLWQLVQEYAVRESAELNFVECTNFLALYTSQHKYNQKLFDSLENQAVNLLISELESGASDKDFRTHPSLRSRVKDLARFMWAMTTVSHPLKESTLNYVTEWVTKRLEVKEYEGQFHILIDTLQSFILANHYPPAIFSTGLHSSVHKIIYKSEKAKPKYQLYFVEKSVTIEQPEIRMCSMNLFYPIPKKLNSEIEERKGFKDLVRFLERHHPRQFKSCYIMPHIMIGGIFLSKPGSSSNELYHQYISDGIISKQVQELLKSDRDYYCIEVLDSSVCVQESSQPVGLMQTKIRQLKKLSLNVIALSSQDIEDIIQSESNAENIGLTIFNRNCFTHEVND